MKATTDNKTTRLRNIKITESPELDKIFGGRILFPAKNRLAEEQISKYGLPKELMRVRDEDK